MAMIRCPECQKPISESAYACPGCGCTLTPDIAATQKVKKQQSEQVALIVVGGIFLLTIVFCSGVLTSSSSSPTSVSPSSASSWESRTAGIQYDDATDRRCKDLPSLRGYSDREKEQIISAAKKLTNATNQLERERGY